MHPEAHVSFIVEMMYLSFQYAFKYVLLDQTKYF